MAIEVEELNGKRRTGPPVGPGDADDEPGRVGNRGVVPVTPTGEVASALSNGARGRTAPVLS